MQLPADLDVGVRRVRAVAGHQGVGIEGSHQRVGVTHGLDDVGLRIGDALQLDRVALALDAGGGAHPLPGDGDRGRAAAPQRVDDGLDVLLVHDQLGDLDVVGDCLVQDVVRRVAERDRQAWPAARLEAGRVLQLLDPAAGAGDPQGADVLGE